MWNGCPGEREWTRYKDRGNCPERAAAGRRAMKAGSGKEDI